MTDSLARVSSAARRRRVPSINLTDPTGMFILKDGLEVYSLAETALATVAVAGIAVGGTATCVAASPDRAGSRVM